MYRTVLAAGMLACLALASSVGEAHKPITSKYTYVEDVFPIFRDRCGRCHVAGGIAPMSLMTYAEAVPWAESIRAELIAGHMPPWYAEEGPTPIKGSGHTLSARELDIVLIWASGGTPKGGAQRLPAVPLKRDWPSGAPDLALTVPAPFTVAADVMEDSHEFVFPANTSVDRFVGAVDLLPGEPGVVRDATIAIRYPNQTESVVLGAWVPGQDPVRPSAGAFRMPAGSEIVLNIHYRKTWKFEGTAVEDRSTVGLYFVDAAAPPAAIRELMIAAPAESARDGGRVVFSHRIDENIDALAVRPETNRSDMALRVDAVLPNQSRVDLIRLTTRRHWDRRYWFERPVSLPRGSRIDVTATARAGSSAADTARSAEPLRLFIDVVPTPARRVRR